MKRAFLAVGIVALCMGQLCGGPLFVVEPQGIPQGTYFGDITYTGTATSFDADSGDEKEAIGVDPTTVEFAADFGASGELLNNQGNAVAPGDYITVELGEMHLDAVVESQHSGNNKVLVVLRVTGSAPDPETGEPIALAGRYTQSYEFVAPNQVLVDESMTLTSEAYDGDDGSREFVYLEMRWTGTLYK